MTTHYQHQKGSDYYDKLFERQQYYNDHYSNIHYYVQWVQVEMILRPFRNKPILEIGCGTGQFAQMLHDLGYRDYRGFDFSEKAIEMAKERVDMPFLLGDAFDPKMYEEPYDAVVCLEVLEHLNEDLKVLDNIDEGKFVVISVPNFDDKSHVRWFRSQYQIRKRYYKKVDIQQIRFINNVYVFSGIRKDFTPNFFQWIFKTRRNVGLASFWVSLKHRLVHIFKIKHE